MNELQNLTNSNNNKILVVLPINKVEDFFLNECLYSIAEQEQPVDLLILTNNLDETSLNVINNVANSPTIVFPKKNEKGEVIQEQKTATKKLNFVITPTEADTFAKIFNEAFNIALTNNYEWFSIVEPDDAIENNWYKNVLVYSKTKTEIDGFLPLTKEISNGSFLGFFNEADWVDGLSEVPGTLDLNLLLRFNCANITGTAFKTQSIKKQSMLVEENNYYRPMKDDFRINYIHEFFLRMVYNDLKFYTIPRIGYEHRIDRAFNKVNCFSSKIPRDILSKSKEDGGMTADELNFWTNMAKKEYYYNSPKRLVNYEEKVTA